MRLTIINQYYKPDLAPTGHFAASLAEHRASIGDDVTVVSSTGGYVQESSSLPTSTSENPNIIRFWTPHLGKDRAFKRIIDYASFYIQAAVRLLIMPPQDVIVSLTTPPFIAWAAGLHKMLHPTTKIVLWNMDSYPEILEQTGVVPEGSLISMVLRWINHTLFQRLDHLVCLDAAMDQMLSEHYRLNEIPLPSTVIPNWEPWDQFSLQSEPRAWKSKLERDLADRFVILYLGNAGFGHRFETVLEAADELRGEPIIFLFVGGGKKWAHLQAEKSRRQLDNLHLLPYVPKEVTPSVMALADLALITLNDSALGVISPSKMHSNLAMRLPIAYIGPEGGNVDQAIRQFKCGVSLRHGQVSEFIDFVQRLRRDGELASRYKHNARNAFELAYNDRVALPKFDELLDSLG